MEFEYGSSDFGVDYTRLTSSPKTPKRGSARTPKGDRFIPNRSAMDMDIAHFNLMKENQNPNTENPLMGKLFCTSVF